MHVCVIIYTICSITYIRILYSTKLTIYIYIYIRYATLSIYYTNYIYYIRYAALSGNYPRALKCYLRCGDKEIDAAIEVVGKSQNDSLTHQLIDFLQGEKDGLPKDQNYFYRLYMALGKYEEAAKIALIIARQEQDIG